MHRDSESRQDLVELCNNWVMKLLALMARTVEQKTSEVASILAPKRPNTTITNLEEVWHLMRSMRFTIGNGHAVSYCLPLLDIYHQFIV